MGEESGTDDSEYAGRRGKKGRKGGTATRRSTRDRKVRYDAMDDFVVDGSDSEDLYESKKKKRNDDDSWNSSDDDESYGKKKKKKSVAKFRPQKKKLGGGGGGPGRKRGSKIRRYDSEDSDYDKKRKKKLAEIEENMGRGRRTRGKPTINYSLMEGSSDSDPEASARKKE